MTLLLDRMSRAEIDELVMSACGDGYTIQDRDDFGIDVYDEVEDWFMRYSYLETLDVRGLVEFNSLKVDEGKFWRLFESCVDYNSLMTVEKIVFVSNEDELDVWLEHTDYTQSFDMDEAVGIYWRYDNIVLVNVNLIEQSVRDINFNFDGSTYAEEMSLGLMETLVHELRHVLTMNPIIPEELVPGVEALEDSVEEYCRAVTHSILVGHPDLEFVK